MPDLMLQVHHTGGQPTLAEVRSRFGLAAAEVDEDYGVVPTDRMAGLYVILIKPEAASKVEAALSGNRRHPAEGVFGNPPIESFDPRRGS